MANRILRDYTDSIAVNNLSEGAETFFVRLMSKADDYGKFHANPKLLKANLFPLKDKITEKLIVGWLAECHKNGLIIKYSVNGRDFLQIIRFGQRLRKMNSKFPDPETIIETDNQTPPIAANGSKPPPETETEVETEVETETREKGFRPPTLLEVSDFFKTKNVIGKEPQKFFDYYSSKGWMVGKNKMKDWQAAISGWITRMEEFKNNNGSQLSPTSKQITKDGFGKL